jgi:hypothetical protein
MASTDWQTNSSIVRTGSSGDDGEHFGRLLSRGRIGGKYFLLFPSFGRENLTGRKPSITNNF